MGKEFAGTKRSARMRASAFNGDSGGCEYDPGFNPNDCTDLCLNSRSVKHSSWCALEQKYSKIEPDVSSIPLVSKRPFNAAASWGGPGTCAPGRTCARPSWNGAALNAAAPGGTGPAGPACNAGAPGKKAMAGRPKGGAPRGGKAAIAGFKGAAGGGLKTAAAGLFKGGAPA